jgi:hypothetical protein
MLIVTGRANTMRRGLLIRDHRRFVRMTSQTGLDRTLALMWFVALDAVRMLVPLLRLVAIHAIASGLRFRVALMASEAVRVTGLRPRSNSCVFLFVAVRACGPRNLEFVRLVARGAILVTARKHCRGLRWHLAFVAARAQLWSLWSRPVYCVTRGAPRVAFDCRLAMLRHDALVAPLAVHSATSVRSVWRMRVVTQATRVDVTVGSVCADDFLAD